MEDKTFELLTKMYSEFSEFRTETNSKFNNIEKRLDSIEGHVLRIENKQNDDSKALYDGYNQTFENTNEIKKDVKEIKETLNVHEVKLLKVK